MGRARVVVVVVVAIAATTLVGSPSDAALTPTFVECGDTIKKSIRVVNNLDCPLVGLRIGKSGITIDLGGHRFEGGGGAGGYGIVDNDGHSDVTIRNGVLDGFNEGVRLDETRDSVVTNLVIRSTVQQGIIVIIGKRNVIKRNTFLQVGTSGVDMTTTATSTKVIGNTFIAGAQAAVNASADKTTIRGNRFYGSGGVLGSGDNTVIEKNRFVAAGGDGAIKLFGQSNTINGNVIRGSPLDGVTLASSNNNVITNNVITGSGRHGIQFASSNENSIKDNITSANDENGMEVDGDNNVLLRNTAHENGIVGLRGVGNTNTFTNSRTNYNGYFNGVASASGLGINTGAGSPGSGNTAIENASGSPECSPASICTEIPIPDSTFSPSAVSCGETLTISTRVVNNLSGCGADGLQVGAAGVTLDLGGHRFEGTGGIGEFGIDDSGGHDNLTIDDVVLVGFGSGAVVINGATATLDSIAAVDSTAVGIEAGASSGTTITDAVSMTSGVSGIKLSSPSSTISRAVSVDNGAEGIELSASSQTTVDGAQLLGNDSNGLAGKTVTSGVFTGNVAVGNELSGIDLNTNSNTNTIEKNSLRGNTQNGLSLDSSPTNVIRRNKAVANGIIGMGQDSAAGNTYTRNVASANVGNGIFSPTASVTISRNKANENGFGNGDPPDDDNGRGIQAPAGALGANNTAKRNDDPSQCAPASLC